MSETPRSSRSMRGPRPSGGVGGTHTGVKCLHAHYAFHLAGGDDPVGRWVEDQTRERSRRLMRVAAIDIGTNSTRLLVADVDGGENGSAPDRRASHADHAPRPRCRRPARRLHPDAIERTVGRLREYRSRIDDLGVPHASV